MPGLSLTARQAARFWGLDARRTIDQDRPCWTSPSMWNATQSTELPTIEASNH